MEWTIKTYRFINWTTSKFVASIKTTLVAAVNSNGRHSESIIKYLLLSSFHFI